MLDHYGLSREEPSVNWKLYISKVIVEDPNLFAAITGGLPLDLSKEFFDGFESSNIKWRVIVKALVKMSTPLARIQLCRLLGAAPQVAPYKRLRNRLIGRLLSSNQLEECEALLSLLNWTSDQFATWSEARRLSGELRLALAWLHANNLFNLMRDLGQSTEWIKETFAAPYKTLKDAITGVDLSIRSDCSAPEHLTADRLRLGGIVYALTGTELLAKQTALIDLALIRVTENEYWPQASLFRFPAPHNQLESFLGIDLASTITVHIPQFENLKSAKLEGVGKEAINRIKEQNQADFWWLVLWNLCDLPFSNQNLTQSIQDLIREQGLYRLARETTNSFIPISLAGTHCAEIPELREKLTIDIKLLARDSAELVRVADINESRVREVMLYREFIHSSIRLCTELSGELAVERFTNQVLDLSKHCRRFAPGVTRLMEEFWHELPIEAASALWKLRAGLRALDSAVVESDEDLD